MMETLTVRAQNVLREMGVKTPADLERHEEIAFWGGIVKMLMAQPNCGRGTAEEIIAWVKASKSPEELPAFQAALGNGQKKRKRQKPKDLVAVLYMRVPAKRLHECRQAVLATLASPVKDSCPT